MSEKALSRKAWEKDVDAYIAEMNQLVGKPCVASIDIGGTWPQAHSYVTEEVIKDFAWNTGCNNPLFTDPEYAKNTVWGGVIAPAGRFLQYIAETGYFPRGRSIPGVTSLYGGTTYDCYGVVRAGEHYHIVDEFLGVTEKTSDNPYRLLVKTSKRNYVNQDGKTVVTATGNTIMTCKFPEEGKGGGSVFSNIVRPHYSDEELEAIHRHYEDYYDGKLTRGAETRYWEDVSENEELTPLIKGPLDIIDVIGILCGVGSQLGGAATKWRLTKTWMKTRDPETGEYIPMQAFHFSDAYARAMGSRSWR